MQKIESRAISAEVAGLFDKIRSQAREYCDLMDELRSQAASNRQHSKQLQDGYQELRRSTTEALQRMEQLSAEALRSIEEKSHAISRIYQELDSIEKTRNSIVKASQDISARRAEVDKLLKSSEKQIRSLVNEGFGDLENKMALQFKQIKDEAYGLDQKMVGLMDLHRREVKMIQDDIDEFKSKVTETKYIVDETTKIVETMIAEAQEEVERKIGSARIEVDRMIKGIALPEHMEDDQVRKSLDALLGKNTAQGERLKELESKIARAQLLAVTTSIAAIVLALLVSFAN